MKWLLFVGLTVAAQDVDTFVQQNAARLLPKAARVRRPAHSAAARPATARKIETRASLAAVASPSGVCRAA